MKYLEVPDFHFDPQWLEISLACANAVTEFARKHRVDAILVPGDFFNRPIFASDKGGINAARSIINNWAFHAPVYAIEGTPSHDAPGCYGFLEDSGLRICRPGSVHLGPADSIIFGIPELSTENIHVNLNLSSEEANAEAVNLLRQYLEGYVAPMRAKHQDLIALGMLHGNITDAQRENQNDIILKASDILIHTEDLRLAGLDRWTLGHIHTPWESNVISAGYAGFPGLDDNPWGKRGFVPSFNLVEIDAPGSAILITRIPYGTPMRTKCTHALDDYRPEVAYWLETDDPDATCPTGHPWSRITRKPKEKIKHLDAVTEDMSLAAMFKAYDKDVSPSVLDKVETLTKTIQGQTMEPIQVEVTSLEVTGCIFWKSRRLSLDLTTLPSGISAIRGNNGEGKSSTLAFCTPYPVIVGKDTESGRESAIKEFFDQPESSIRKTVYRNGVKHEHVITIKAAHTKSAKTECFLFIDGVNQLETTSFDEMMTLCESFYGPFADYLITTFYIQPDQSQQRSGLMASKRVDARNVVQAITGVDRSKEQRYALDRQSALKSDTQAKRAYIQGLESTLPDQATLEADLTSAKASLISATATLAQVTESGKALAEQVRAAQEAADRSQFELNRQATNQAKISTATANIAKLEALSNQLPRLKADLEAISAYKLVAEANRALKTSYQDRLSAWTAKDQAIKTAWQSECYKINASNQAKANDYAKECRDYDAKKSRLEIELTKARSISLESCPSCGYVDPEINDIYQAAQTSADEIESDLADMEMPVPADTDALPVEPVNPEPKPVEPTYAQEDPPFADETETLAKILEAESSSAKISVYRQEIASLNAETYLIDLEAPAKLQSVKQAHELAQTAWREAMTNRANLEARITSYEATLKAVAADLQRLEAARQELKTLEVDTADWGYIARTLQPAGIPALELERNLTTIDRDATSILSPFMSGQYSIRTEAAEGFDILVHDGESGQETSFFKRNPGHKAFFADAYTKALIRSRNERHHRSYSPIIMDEADAPIQETRVGMYYAMQEGYFNQSEAKVLVVSQKDPAYIQHAINIKEITK